MVATYFRLATFFAGALLFSLLSEAAARVAFQVARNSHS
jgi:hypothetical protein